MKFSDLSIKDKEEYIFKMAGIYFQNLLEKLDEMEISHDREGVDTLREMCDFLNGRI